MLTDNKQVKGTKYLGKYYVYILVITVNKQISHTKLNLYILVLNDNM